MKKTININNIGGNTPSLNSAITISDAASGIIGNITVTENRPNDDPMITKFDDNTGKNLDSLLIYDYYNNRNMILFKPKLFRPFKSPIVIRKIDVMRARTEELPSGNSTRNDNNKGPVYEYTINKEQARKNVEDNKKILFDMGIDIDKEVDAVKVNTDFQLSINTTTYKYDEYETKLRKVTKKYLDALDNFRNNILYKDSVFPNPSITDNDKIKQTITKKLITNLPSYKLIDSDHRNKVNHRKTLAGVPERGTNENISFGINGLDKTVPGVQQFLNEFQSYYSINIASVYNKACADIDGLEYPTPYIQNKPINKTQALEFIYFYWTRDGQNNLKSDNNISDILTTFINTGIDTITKRSLIEFEVMLGSFLGEIQPESWWGDVDNIRKQIQVLESQIKQGIIKPNDFSLEDVGKMIHYYKRQASIKFINELVDLIAPAKNRIEYPPDLTTRDFINFVLLSTGELDKTNYSIEEYILLNTYEHNYTDNTKQFDSYDLFNTIEYNNIEAVKRSVGFEKQAEKMGLYIDDNILPDKEYLYLVLQN